MMINRAVEEIISEIVRWIHFINSEKDYQMYYFKEIVNGANRINSSIQDGSNVNIIEQDKIEKHLV